jgi:hypothetical protein
LSGIGWGERAPVQRGGIEVELNLDEVYWLVSFYRVNAEDSQHAFCAV